MRKSCGLSLCIQGTRKSITLSANATRFIPVYTGNTIYRITCSSSNAVYPCVYREHCWDTWITARDTGLSLCIQGTPQQSAPLYLAARFIPVYTGNTDWCNSLYIQHAVYPCVYREHFKLKNWKRKRSRFIPVYTGNTTLEWKTDILQSVYPCVYREH